MAQIKRHHFTLNGIKQRYIFNNKKTDRTGSRLQIMKCWWILPNSKTRRTSVYHKNFNN